MVVSVVHVVKGAAPSPVLDGRQVRRISAYLVEGDLDASPARLVANAGKSFQGMILLGMGFTFDDAAAAKGKASSVAEMDRLIEKDPRNAGRIFPMIGGEEVTTSPTHAHHRWCIDFNDFPLHRDGTFRSWFLNEGTEACDKRRRDWLRDGVVPVDYPGPVAEDWPDLIEIVRRTVKPDREPQKRKALRERWWQYAEKRPGLRAALEDVSRVLVNSSKATPHHALAFLPKGLLYAQNLNVLILDSDVDFCAVQSRPHEIWVRLFGTTMKDDFTYAKDECFETFPFHDEEGLLIELSSARAAYNAHRSALMVARNEGMTKTYNRFHDAGERAEDIRRLRELHHDLDRAVLRAYGWDDLADRAAPVHLTEDDEPDHRYQGRLFWPGPFRDEVLARLLDLNRARAAEERALGLSAHAAAESEEEDSDAA